MERLDVRAFVDERAWEHRLFPMLVAAFAVASAATFATAITTRPAPPPAPPAATTAVTQADHAPKRPSVAARGDHLVAVTIADVVVNEGSTASVALLMDAGKEWVLPLFLDAREAETLRQGLHRPAAERTGAATLLGQTVRMMGGTVARVEVDDVDGEACLGQVVVLRGDKEIAIDARPEDALAVALATGSPVYAASRVLSSRGIKREDVTKAIGGVPANLGHTEHL